MEAAIKLVPAIASDFPAIVALVNSAYRGETARQGWTHEADYIEGARIDANMLAADFARAPDAMLLLAREDTRADIAGCVWLEPWRDGIWYLGLLTVRPTWQARGLGRIILADAEAAARAVGARRMRMTVVSIRDTLIAWYIRRGYALTGEREPFPYGDPPRTDLEFAVLEKPLA